MAQKAEWHKEIADKRSTNDKTVTPRFRVLGLYANRGEQFGQF